MPLTKTTMERNSPVLKNSHSLFVETYIWIQLKTSFVLFNFYGLKLHNINSIILYIFFVLFFIGENKGSFI